MILTTSFVLENPNSYRLITKKDKRTKGGKGDSEQWIKLTFKSDDTLLPQAEREIINQLNDLTLELPIQKTQQLLNRK